MTRLLAVKGLMLVMLAGLSFSVSPTEAGDAGWILWGLLEAPAIGVVDVAYIEFYPTRAACDQAAITTRAAADRQDLPPAWSFIDVLRKDPEARLQQTRIGYTINERVEGRDRQIVSVAYRCFPETIVPRFH